MYKYITNFGFGSKTGIALNGEGNEILFKKANIVPFQMMFGMN